jgi:hypothetical protein
VNRCGTLAVYASKGLCDEAGSNCVGWSSTNAWAKQDNANKELGLSTDLQSDVDVWPEAGQIAAASLAMACIALVILLAGIEEGVSRRVAQYVGGFSLVLAALLSLTAAISTYRTAQFDPVSYQYCLPESTTVRVASGASGMWMSGMVGIIAGFVTAFPGCGSCLLPCLASVDGDEEEEEMRENKTNGKSVMDSEMGTSNASVAADHAR